MTYSKMNFTLYILRNYRFCRK